MCSIRLSKEERKLSPFPVVDLSILPPCKLILLYIPEEQTKSQESGGALLKHSCRHRTLNYEIGMPIVKSNSSIKNFPMTLKI